MVTWLLILFCTAAIIVFVVPLIVTGVIFALEVYDNKKEAKKWRR